MHGAQITASGLCYQTSGSCALAPHEAAYSGYLRLVEDADVIALPRTTCERARHTQARGVSEPQDDRAKLLRGVIAFVIGLLAMASALLWSDAMAARAQAHALSGVTFEEVTVHAGDSLWTLAADHGVDGLSTAEVVTVIRRQNSLSVGLIHPGDTLDVPASAAS